MHSLRGRDFLSLGDITPAELTQILSTAHAQKRAWAREERNTPLAGKSIALIFQKPSMRTRVSFELACIRLGAHPIVMSGSDSAFSRSESVYDTTKVLERYCDAIVIRTFAQSMVEEIAEVASVPVINALTDDHHPCQGLADLLTIEEHLGTLEGVRIAYVGDGNNMAHTYLLGGALAGMHVSIACPEGFQPLDSVVEQARSIAEETGATIIADDRPGRRRDRRRRRHHRHLGVDGPGGRARHASGRFPAVPGQRHHSWRTPPTARSSCTAYLRTAARRSSTKSSMPRTRSSSTRPRTACTHRRRCSHCFSASLRPTTDRG